MSDGLTSFYVFVYQPNPDITAEVRVTDYDTIRAYTNDDEFVLSHIETRHGPADTDESQLMRATGRAKNARNQLQNIQTVLQRGDDVDPDSIDYILDEVLATLDYLDELAPDG